MAKYAYWYNHDMNVMEVSNNSWLDLRPTLHAKHLFTSGGYISFPKVYTQVEWIIQESPCLITWKAVTFVFQQHLLHFQQQCIKVLTSLSPSKEFLLPAFLRELHSTSLWLWLALPWWLVMLNIFSVLLDTYIASLLKCLFKSFDCLFLIGLMLLLCVAVW